MAASQQAAIFSGNVGIFDLSGSFDDLARMPIVVFFCAWPGNEVSRDCWMARSMRFVAR